ncbi:MAG: hypothetical protein ACOYYS_17505 [Chloroflexota bacterium]
MHQNPVFHASDLSPEEINLLNTLRRTGSALPAELAVKNFLLPEQIYQTLGKLKEKKLIDLHPVPGAYGELVSLSKSGIDINPKSGSWS